MDDLGVLTQMNPKERENVMECFNMAQDRVNWQNLTKELMNLLVS
jgi:truncated hemoglobin YjbI